MIKKLLLCIFAVSLMVFTPKTIIEAEDEPNYLCFEKTTEGSATIKLEQKGTPASVNLQYRKDLNAWENYTIGSEITLNFGEKLYFRNTSSETTGFGTSNNDYYKFVINSASFDIKVSGDITTLINSNGNVEQLSDRCFFNLFSGCSRIITTPELPSTKMGESCYEQMFNNCSSIVSPPELPATVLAKRCYCYMFGLCTNLKTPPQLPATTLAESCYFQMFFRCSALESVPELPATVLAPSCYKEMFSRCEKITTPSQLPSTVLESSCYEEMFYLTGITSTPELPATTLAPSCYKGMFKSCKQIEDVPQLPATKLAPSCYEEMFATCAKIDVAPQLPATKLVDSCYKNMFKGAAIILPPQLPATTLADSCYEGMFSVCNQLESAPQLPATTLAPSCYKSMFQSCTSLAAPPQLPATVAPASCYESMFQSCTGLVTLPELPATVLKENCYASMFRSCSNIYVSYANSTPAYSATSYKIPSSGQYTLEGTNQFNNMFVSTKGALKTTPNDAGDGIEDNVISLYLKAFTVTYDKNTGSGDVPTDTNSYAYGKDVIVLDKGSLTNIDLNFNGWNTEADGSGITYMPKETFKIEGDTTLYAIWEKYQFIEGMNQTYVKESNKDSSFRCDGEYSDPSEVTVFVDKETIDAEKYSLSKGSTIITLKKSYLDTLNDGWHELEVTYTDGGKATTRFYIQKPTYHPEERHIVLDTGVN